MSFSSKHKQLLDASDLMSKRKVSVSKTRRKSREVVKGRKSGETCILNESQPQPISRHLIAHENMVRDLSFRNIASDFPRLTKLLVRFCENKKRNSLKMMTKQKVEEFNVQLGLMASAVDM